MMRSDLLNYAVSQYRELMLEAKISPTDDETGLRFPLDLVSSAVGGDFATAGAGACYALTDYHVLARIARSIAARVDVQTTGFAKSSGQQVFDRLQLLMAAAKAQVESYGYSVGGNPALTDASGLYTLGLDFIELPAVD